MLQVCAALSAAHDRGIVHRDVKPDNIMAPEQARLPSELVPDLPRGMEAIILRAIEKEPELRFPAVRELRLELKRLRQQNGSWAGALPFVPGTDRRAQGRRV